MTQSVKLFGMDIDPVRMDEAISQILDWFGRGGGKCQYVVTPNVDHAVMFQHHEGLRLAYKDAGLVLADGFPVLVAARLLGRPIPERVPGSDLVPALFKSASREA